MAYPKTKRKNPRTSPRPTLKDATHVAIRKGKHKGKSGRIVLKHGHAWFAIQFAPAQTPIMFHSSYLRAATVEDVK